VAFTFVPLSFFPLLPTVNYYVLLLYVELYGCYRIVLACIVGRKMGHMLQFDHICFEFILVQFDMT
jgi:hypothetical protein